MSLCLVVCLGLSAQAVWSCLGPFRLCRYEWWLCSCTAGSGLSSTRKTCKNSAAPPQPGQLCIPARSTPAHSHLVPAERFLGMFQNRATIFWNCFDLWVRLSRLFSCEMVLPSILPLHLLPAVPGIPFSGSRWQKSGEGARYRRSLAAGGLTWGSRGSRAVLDPIRVMRT